MKISKKIDIDLEKLKHLYYVEKLSLEKISEIFNCSTTTIENRLKKENLDKRAFIKKEELVYAIKKFRKFKDIAYFLNTNIETLKKYYTKFNMKYSILLDEEIEYIKSNYYEKRSSDLAKEFNVSESLILSIWIKSGLNGKVNRTYYFDEYYFHNIDKPEKAYFLGFIMADGCVYASKNEGKQMIMRLCLNAKDVYILKLLKKEIKLNKPIIYHEKSDSVSIELVSDILCNKLIYYGIHPRKTWTGIAKNISEDYEIYYIRGLFDADGTINKISKNAYNEFQSDFSLGFCGNKNMVDYFSNLLKKYIEESDSFNIKKDNREEKYSNDFYFISFCKKENIIRFFEIFYRNNEHLCLLRKRALFMDFMVSNSKW